MNKLKLSLKPIVFLGALLSPLSAKAAGFNDLNKQLFDFLNPCKVNGDFELSSINCIAVSIIDYTLDLAGIVAFIMVLYAAIIYLTSYGEESRAELAKKTLTWSVIGIIVITLSKFILVAIKNILYTKTVS